MKVGNIKWPLIAFLIGATSSYDLNLLGRVPLSELIAFSSIPFLVKGAIRVSYKSQVKLVLFATLLWLFGIFISDLIASTDLEDFLRAMMKPIFTIAWALFVLGVLARDKKALLMIPFGEIIATIQNYIAPQSYTASNILSGGYAEVAYGIGPIINSVGVAASLLVYQRSKIYASLCLVVTSLVMGYAGGTRSGMALLLLSALFILYTHFFSFKKKRVSVYSPAKRIFLTISVIVIVAGLFETYIYAANAGWLGEAQQAKLYDQSDNKFGLTPLGLLLGGRAEVFGGILVIIDRPIVGYGSWTAWQMSDYFFDAIQIVGADKRLGDTLRSGVYPGIGHSVLIVAWLENSILAFVAVSILLYSVLKFVSRAVQTDSYLRGYILILAMPLIWSFLASPFSNSVRFQLGFILALFVANYPMMRSATID